MVVDVDKFRRPSDSGTKAAKLRRLPRHKSGEWFLKGPVPGLWLQQAANLPGKALHIALALWHIATLDKHRQVKLSKKALSRFGVTRANTVCDGLARLEQAGLIEVERGDGRRGIVEILDVKKDGNA